MKFKVGDSVIIRDWRHCYNNSKYINTNIFKYPNLECKKLKGYKKIIKPRPIRQPYYGKSWDLDHKTVFTILAISKGYVVTVILIYNNGFVEMGTKGIELVYREKNYKIY